MLQAANPQRVLITGAAGQIGYSLVFAVARGDLLGPNQPVILHLLDIPQMTEGLNGVVLEIEDCALPLVAGMFYYEIVAPASHTHTCIGIVATTDVKEAFTDVDIALLVGSMPRRYAMNSLMTPVILIIRSEREWSALTC